jgi:hypothetical protein
MPNQSKIRQKKKMIKTKNFYKGYKIRFVILPDNGLLFNTSDICRIVDISSDNRWDELTEPSIDKASAIFAAMWVGNEEALDFIDWLNETFIEFSNETPVSSVKIDIWNFY